MSKILFAEKEKNNFVFHQKTKPAGESEEVFLCGVEIRGY